MLDLSYYTEQERRIFESVLACLKPPEKISVVEWANTYRYLSRNSSAEPGKYSTERIKYVEEILLEATNPRIEHIVVQKSAQTGLTEALLTHIGYMIDVDPSPGLYVMPSLSMATDLSKDRLEPLLKETPRLEGKLDFSHLSGNTVLHKKYKGGQIVLAGANSASSLASRPVRFLWLDEVDRYPESAGKEGDPASLALKRTQTFRNRKVFWISTPTIKGLSRIEKAFDESDKRFYYCPCPHCGEHQILEWERVSWINDDPRTSHYACINCGAFWTDLERWTAIKKGFWKPTKETHRIAGFQLNELLSPWSTVERMVSNYLIAFRGGPEQIKEWTNTTLGLPYNENLEETPIADLIARKEDFNSASIPDDVVYLVSATDTQDSRFETTIVGFGPQQETYILDHFITEGCPGDEETFEKLEAILTAKYKKQNGTLLDISVSVLDSGGHYTQQVYLFCNAQMKKGKKIYAIKGKDGDGKMWPKTPSRSATYKGMTYYSVRVDTAKQMIWDRIKITQAGKNYIHFGNRLDTEYFRQLTAEYPKYKINRRGRLEKIWVQKPNESNESFDCLGYSYIALYSHIAQYERLCVANHNIITVQSVRKSSYLQRMKEDA